MKEGCQNGEEEGGAGGRKEGRDWLRYPDLLRRTGSCNYGDLQESWALKNWCFWTAVLEKTLEKPLDSKIKPVHPKGNQSWVFIGRTDAEAETPILRPPDAKNRLIGKDPDAGKDWRWEKKGMTEDEMVGWHHRLNGHEFQQAPWVGDGQGGLACCSPWGWKEPDTTEWLNWTELNWQVQISAETTSLSFKTGNSYRTRNSQCSSLKSEEFSYLGKVSLLSIQAFSGLDEVHPHYGGQSVLFSLRI